MQRWLQLERKPEPELMEAVEDGAAYSGAAAAKHLSKLDDTFVRLALSGPRRKSEGGWLLDVGCGPGGIVLKMARSRPDARIMGIDGSAAMISAAKQAAHEQALSGLIYFVRADAKRLCFRDGAFDSVFSNSVLHHLAEPRTAFQEMTRVLKPGGTVLLRDLRRPSRLGLPLHLRWHGRHYSGRMRVLFEDSVRAAYTPAELATLLRGTCMRGARIFSQGRAHLGFLYQSRTGAR